MPVDPVYLWFLPLYFFIAQGAMGASVARHSLRPLLIPRVKFLTNSGTMSCEKANACSASFRDATGSRECAPDDRLGEPQMCNCRSGNLEIADAQWSI